MTIVIHSLNVGAVKDLVDAAGRPYRSGIRKTPLAAPQFLGVRGFLGDRSFEEAHHTPNMDIHAFSIEHYAHYERLAARRFPIPAFGENFTVAGATEMDVCIGDSFAVGNAVLQISQPTERCKTPGQSLDAPQLLKWAFECLYTGWYMRVVSTGWVAPGAQLRLIDRPLPMWTVDRVNRAVFERCEDERLYNEVLAIDLLSTDWKNRMIVLRNRRLHAQGRNADLRQTGGDTQA